MRLFAGIILLLFFVLTDVQGQQTEAQSKVAQLLELDVAPLTIVSYRPRYRIGFEYYYARWSFNLNGEYGSYGLNQYMLKNSKWGPEYLYTAIRPQIMYSYKSFNGISHHIGIEGFYIHNSDRLENDYFEKLDPSREIYNYDAADYSRIMLGFHVAFKAKKEIYHLLGFEFYIGLGAAYRTNLYSDIDGLRFNESYLYRESLFPKNYREEGAGWLASGTIGLNLTYLIWKN